ncbi:MAG: endo alpha-1,4 polygalactosaminidase, partial [Hyphomicrobiaceae bacterium]
MTTAELALVIGLAGIALVAGYALGRRKSSVPGTGSGQQVPPPSADAAPTAMPPPPAEARPGAASENDTLSKPAAKPSPRSRDFAPVPVQLDNPSELLGRVQSWGYQLQDLDVARAAASPFDLLVVDYAKDGGDDSALTSAEVRRLQTKTGGGRRLVLAYLSIGEAESYRSYWRKDWKRQRPDWLLGENPDWDENYAVCFWDAGWQDLLCGSPGALLDRVMAQGFDGVYLDKCDVTEDLKRRERKAAGQRSDLEADMVALVE